MRLGSQRIAVSKAKHRQAEFIVPWPHVLYAFTSCENLEQAVTVKDIPSLLGIVLRMALEQ